MIDFFYAHGFVVELLITTALFVYFLKHKPYFIIKSSLCIITLFLISITWQTLVPANNYLIILKHITLFMFTFLSILICFETTIWEALFLETSAFTVQHSAYKLGFLIQTMIQNKSGNGYIAIFVYLLIDFLIYVCAYFLFARKIKNERVSSKNKNNQIILMAVALILFTTIFQNLFDFIIDKENLMLLLAVTSYDLVSCVLVISIQFGILKSNRLAYETNLLEHVLRQQKNQMINSKHNMDVLNIKYHDLKYKINTIGHQIDENERTELNKVVNAYDLYVDTGNETLNVVLSEKKLLCENNSIKLNYMIDGKQLNFMQASDIYSLFGNALDNAITAVLSIKEIEKRNIYVQLKKVMNMAVITFENYYEGEIIFAENMPITTKNDTDFHGFGMRSIKYIVEKYHGFMSIKTLNHKFMLSISFEKKID